MAMAAEKNKKHSQNTENGVVITVYVESSRTRSSYKLSKKDLTKKTKPQNESKKTCGFDRKAELLAYSRHLRTIEASQKVHVQSQPRIKKNSCLAKPIRICSPSTRIKPSLSTFFEPKGSMKRKCGGNKYCYLFLVIYEL